MAELPLSTQVRLLRVLETGEFMRVGSSKNQKTDVRVIAASNVDITKAVENGKFREGPFLQTQHGANKGSVASRKGNRHHPSF